MSKWTAVSPDTRQCSWLLAYDATNPSRRLLPTSRYRAETQESSRTKVNGDPLVFGLDGRRHSRRSTLDFYSFFVKSYTVSAAVKRHAKAFGSKSMRRRGAP